MLMMDDEATDQPQEQKQIRRLDEDVLREPIQQYYDPAKWQRIFERLSTLWLTQTEFAIHAGRITECCDRQATYLLTGRPQRVIHPCCHNRQVESISVPCVEICCVSHERYPSTLILQVEGCINAAPARQHRMLLTVQDQLVDDDSDLLYYYAPDSFVTWLEGPDADPS